MIAALTSLAAATLLAIALRWATAIPTRHLVAYAALSLAVFAPAIVGPVRQLPLDVAAQLPPYADDPGVGPLRAQNPVLSDVVTQMLPFRTEVRAAWLAGALPLWSHRLGTGQPLWTNPQAAVLAPLHLVTLGLEPTRGMSVAAALQTLVLLVGAEALARALGASGLGAVLAAVVAAWSSFHLVWLYHPHGMVYAWIPLFLVGVLGLARGERRAPVVATVAGCTLLASGQPQIALYAVMAGALAWCLALAARQRPARHAAATTTVGAGLVTACLCAPLVLPTLADLPWSERALLLASDPGSLNPMDGRPSLWLPVIDPFAFGSPRDGNWNGPWNYNEVASAWAGTVPTALAVAAAIASGGLVRGLMVAGAIALAIAHRTPLLGDLADLVPGLAATTTGRLRLFWPLAVALTAGLGAGQLTSSARLRRLAAGCLLTLALVRGSGATVHDLAAETEAQRLARTIAVAVGLLAAGAVLAADRWPRRGGAALVLLSAGELFASGLRYQPWVSDRLVSPPAAVVELGKQVDAARGERVSAVGGRFLPYDPVRFGLADPRGFDPLRPAASLQLLRNRLHRPALAGYFLILPSAATDPLLDRLGVGWAIGPPALATTPGWRESARFGSSVLARNEEVLPLAIVPTEVRTAVDARAALTGAAAASQPARRVWAESTGPHACPLVPASGEPDPLVELDDNAVRLRRTAAAAPVLLATTISFMPGWVATTAGTATCRVDGAFLAIVAGSGVDTIDLRYRPPRWSLSLAMAVIGLAAAAAWAAARTRRQATLRC